MIGKSLITAAIIYGACSVDAGVVAKNRDTALDFGPQGEFTVKGVNQGALSAFGEFYLYDGKQKKNVKLPAPKITGDSLGLSLKYDLGTLVWTLKVKPEKRLILLESEIKNTGKTERLLEPGIKLKLKDVSGVKECWTGFGFNYPFGKKDCARKGVKGSVEKHTGASTRPFPAAAVFGDKFALFAGGVPFDPVSYNAAGISKVRNGASTMTYSIRNAVLPGTSVKSRYTLGVVPQEFGGREAVVQAYYDSMPELWTPVVGQDNPYIWGAHGQYILWWKKPEYEVARRLYVTNEWTYCPYRRSGDMQVRKELWDYKPLGKDKKAYLMCGTKYNYQGMTREKFIEMRRDIFRKYARQFGLMFYNSVIGTWCEAQLAKQKYPDAIVHDKSVPYYLKQWSTHHDHEVRVFPMGTSFAKAFEEDTVYVTKELDLPGFAFDCAYGGAYYRGPAIKKNLPGRAWDDKGVFIDQSVAINHIVDFTHNIIKTKNPAEKLVVFSNGYLKGDYIMVEEEILGVAKYKEWMPLLRYHIGPRPSTSHGHGFRLSKIITNWREKTTEDFKTFLPKLADYVIFNEFKYGLITNHLIGHGNPQVVYCFPEVIEMMRAGWQAEVPLRYDSNGKKVYQARYGKGQNTFFFIGNPYEEEMPLDVSVANKYLGDDTYLFIRKMRRSASGQNTIHNGETTFQLALQSRTPYLFETVCGLSKIADGTVCKLESRKDINRQEYTVKFDKTSPFLTELKLRQIRHFKLAEVQIDGLNAGFSSKSDGYLTGPVKVAEGSQIKLVYTSDKYKISEKQFLSFGFIDAAKNVDFSVVIPAKPSKEEVRAANMLQEYFAFCADKKVINKRSPQVKIVKSDTIPAKGNVIVINGKSCPVGVTMPSARLLMVKSADIVPLIKDMEYVMDRRFKYIMPFVPVMGLYSNQLTHFKMHGKSLPYRKYFEASK